MSEQTQSAAPVQPTTLTIAQAAQAYAESKVKAGNQVSDAARTLGQRAAQARTERQASTAAAQEPNEGEQQPEENTLGVPDGETTETELAPGHEDNQTDEDLADDTAETIDIGEGVKLSKAEIRENILRRADYTRKTEEVARERKALESERSQKLAQLDDVVKRLQQQLGQPKEIDAFVEEFGADVGLKEFAKQSRQIRAIQHAQAVQKDAEARAWVTAVDSRDKQLAETYNKAWSDPAKRDADYTKLTAFALKRGATPETIRGMTEPWMIEVLDLARQQVEAKSKTSEVTKTLSGKPTVVKPGAKVSAQASQHNTIQQAQQRLKQSGSIADGVALLRAQRRG